MKKQDDEDVEAWEKRELDLRQAKRVDHNPDANINQLKRLPSPSGSEDSVAAYDCRDRATWEGHPLAGSWLSLPQPQALFSVVNPLGTSHHT